MTDIPKLREIAGTTCLVNEPSQPQARLLFAHGAGAAMDSSFMLTMAQLLAARGVEVVRFEFPYMSRRRETGRRSPPDRLPVMQEFYKTLIHQCGDELPLFIGGKSMGGRLATLVASEAPGVAGMICMGYPFHAIGKPEKLRNGIAENLRTEHLLDLTVPTLILQGTRDPMGAKADVAALPLSAAVEIVWLESANHDLKPLKTSGFSYDDYLHKAADISSDFIHRQPLKQR